MFYNNLIILWKPHLIIIIIIIIIKIEKIIIIIIIIMFFFYFPFQIRKMRELHSFIGII